MATEYTEQERRERAAYFHPSPQDHYYKSSLSLFSRSSMTIGEKKTKLPSSNEMPRREKEMERVFAYILRHNYVKNSLRVLRERERESNGSSFRARAARRHSRRPTAACRRPSVQSSRDFPFLSVLSLTLNSSRRNEQHMCICTRSHSHAYDGIQMYKRTKCANVQMYSELKFRLFSAFSTRYKIH